MKPRIRERNRVRVRKAMLPLSSFFDNALDPTNDPLIQMSEMFDALHEQKGTKRMFSDDICAEGIAYGMVTTWSEECVLNKAFARLCLIAARRFKIQGGMVPDMEKYALIQKKARQLFVLRAKCPWIAALAERYNLQVWETPDLYKGRDWRKEFGPLQKGDLR